MGSVGTVHNAIAVEVWSDVACPWCFIGHRRLAAAIDQVSTESPGSVPVATVTYRSYQLTPDAPVSFDGSELQFQLRYKDRTRQEAVTMMADAAAAGAAEGLRYDFERLRPTNTRSAHELLHWADTLGRRSPLLDACYSAHFEQGVDVGEPAALVSLAGQVDLDTGEAAAVLADGRFRAAVAAEQMAAGPAGVRGVPFVIVDGRFRIAGTPDVKTYADTFRHVLETRPV